MFYGKKHTNELATVYLDRLYFKTNKKSKRKIIDLPKLPKMSNKSKMRKTIAYNFYLLMESSVFPLTFRIR